MKNKKIKQKTIKDTKTKKHTFMKGIVKKIKDKFLPSKTYLIEMLHTNGTVSHSIISSQIHKFNYGGSVYLIDEDRKIYCNTTKQYMLRYHEGFAIPFSIEVTSQGLKKGLREHDNYAEDLKEVSTSFNPYVLKDILKFEYAKGVIQGAEVSEFIKRSFILLIIILVLGLVHLALAAYKGGWI